MEKKSFLTPRERTLRAFNFEKGDRVASVFVATGEYAERLKEKYGPDIIDHLDGRALSECIPSLAWPSAPGKWVEESGDKIWWYTDVLFNDYEEADKLELPDPRNSPHLFDNLHKSLKEIPNNAKVCNIFGPLTLLHGMRNVANLYADVIEDPDGLHRLIKRVMDIQTDVVRQAVELPYDIIYFQDDIAASRALIMSPKTTCEFVLDYFQEAIAIAKKAGKKTAFHSDGNVTDILDDLYRIGIDAVNPMQPQFNDFEEFMRRFDQKMLVFGGIDNYDVLPYGTPEDVKNHVEYVFNTLGKNGGLVLSTHQIKNPVSDENWDAFYSAIYNCWY